MPGQNKEVRIAVVVDQASLEAAKTALGSVIEQVRELARLVQQTGGGGGLNFSNLGSTPGSSAATQATHANAGGGAAPQKAGGGWMSFLAGGVQGDATIISRAADAAKTSIKSMKDGLRELSDAGERESARLARSFGKLAPLYAAANAQVASQRSDILKQAGLAETERTRPPEKEGLLGKLGGMLGGGLGTLAAGYLGWKGIRAAEQLFVGSYMQNQFAQTGYNLAQPTWAGNAQAQGGDIFGANAVNIRHGDFARAWAMNTISNPANKEAAARNYQTVISEKYKDTIKQQIKQVAPVTLGEAVKKNIAEGGTGLGGVWDVAKDRMGRGVGWTMEHPGHAILRGLTLGMAYNGELNQYKNTHLTTMEMNRNAEEARRVTQQAETAQQATENYLRAHPQTRTDMNEFYGSAMGDAGLARAAHLGGGWIKDPKTGKYVDDPLINYQAGATEMGISAGERAAMSHRLASAAGMRFFGRGDSLLSPESGGLSSAASLLGAGAQMGGGTWGAGRSFLQSIQHQIGRGGLDITAGNQMSQMIVSMMTGGNFGAGNGQAFASGLMQMAGADTDPLRGARVAGAGFGSLQNQLSGGTSPLDKALGWSAALRMGGNTPWTARAWFANQKGNLPALMEMMRGGDKNISPFLKGLGVTAGGAKDFFQNWAKTSFSGAIDDSRMMSPEARGAMQRFQASGGNTHYMKGMSRAERQREEGYLAAALHSRSPGTSEDEAMGQVRAMEAAFGDLDTLNGHGAHDSFDKKSIRGQVLKRQAEFDREKKRRLLAGENEKQAITGTLKKMGLTADAAEQAGIDVNNTVDARGINGTIDDLDKILRKFVSQLHGEVGNGQAGPAGG